MDKRGTPVGWARRRVRLGAEVAAGVPSSDADADDEDDTRTGGEGILAMANQGAMRGREGKEQWPKVKAASTPNYAQLYQNC